MLRTVIELVQAGTIQPIYPIFNFDPGQIKHAFQQVHGDRRIGSVCLEFPPDQTEFHADFYAEKIRFSADRSYLLVGGFGGLGKSAAVWLAERGAGYIIFFSRSASAQAAENSSLLRELEALGCSVQIVTGDVTNIADVVSLVANATRPIAGILHLPIVTRVCRPLQPRKDSANRTICRINRFSICPMPTGRRP